MATIFQDFNHIYRRFYEFIETFDVRQVDVICLPIEKKLINKDNTFIKNYTKYITNILSNGYFERTRGLFNFDVHYFNVSP